jgi:hypothetical protein
MDARVREIPDGKRDEVAGLAAVSWMEGGRTRQVGDSAKGLLKFRAEQKATSVIDALNVRRNNVSKEPYQFPSTNIIAHNLLSPLSMAS